MTGIFRKHGRFANHRNLGDWHYSGTFFWMRHASVFARDWRNVPQFYGGVEAWPGMHFARHETGCLLLDNLRELPYQDRFWAQKGNAAAAQWKAALRTVPVPPDLARPLPFDGLVSPRLEQKPNEFALWLERLLESGASSLLTIGGRFGGAEWHVARVFRQQGRSISITALDARPSTERQAAFADARAQFAQTVDEVVGDASEPEARAQLATRYDAVYIDGDHGYRACRRDLLFARSLDPLLIGLHDIVDSDWHAASRCCVSRVWDEARHELASEEMQSGTWGGVGLLHPRRPRHVSGGEMHPEAWSWLEAEIRPRLLARPPRTRSRRVRRQRLAARAVLRRHRLLRARCPARAERPHRRRCGDMASASAAARRLRRDAQHRGVRARGTLARHLYNLWLTLKPARHLSRHLRDTPAPAALDRRHGAAARRTSGTATWRLRTCWRRCACCSAMSNGAPIRAAISTCEACDEDRRRRHGGRSQVRRRGALADACRRHACGHPARAPVLPRG